MIAVLALAVASCPGLELVDGWLREAPPGAAVMAAYMTLRNDGARSYRIEAADGGDFAHAMIHRTVVEDGRARMVHVDALDLPPGGTLTLAPGGLHLMLHAPVRPLRDGDRAALRLSCDGQAFTLTLPVRRAPPAP